MSTCVQGTPQIRMSLEMLHDLEYKSPLSKHPIIVHDLNAPNVVQMPVTPIESRAINTSLLSVHASLGERVKIRCDVEVWIKWRGHRTYKRMRGASVLVSSPNPEQAELFIQALHDFAATLGGKWLAQRPQVTENTMVHHTPGTKQDGGGEI